MNASKMYYYSLHMIMYCTVHGHVICILHVMRLKWTTQKIFSTF